MNIVTGGIAMTGKIRRREKVVIILSSKPNFNEFALKYFILSMNQIQSTYEFTFPEKDNIFYNEESYTDEALFASFDDVKKNIEFEGKPAYFINIITPEIEGNLFFVCSDRVAFITTDVWQRLFSPPSLFEYLLNSIAAVLIFMHPKLGLNSHSDTRGCALDYTRYKMDAKVDTSLGYLCDSCRKAIAEHIGTDYLKDVSTMISRKWIGDIGTFDSVAHNLKRFFKFDINKDSGFNKTFWERAKESLPEIPKEAILLILSFITGAVIAWLSAWLSAYFGE
jgi:hypothetical protein